MYITKTPLYGTCKKRIPLHVQFVALFIAIIAPYHALSNPEVKTEPYEQEFLITMYYSPLPGQCCYVRGGLKADRILNGQGVKAADQTPVFPGMVAAPKSYPFGTKITLPGLGTFAVHDRGGAINELGNGVHRLDIWSGYGEEGLARALAFGMQSVKGTVYPNGSKQPHVYVQLDDLPAPIDELKLYAQSDNFLAMQPKVGDRGLSVYLLQDHLQKIGYLHHKPTGFFGPQTSRAFAQFLIDFQVDASKNQLSEKSAAYVLGARTRLDAREPFATYIDPDASREAVAEAQRMLRFLGYYRGRTNGEYDDTLFASILKFQQDHHLVGTAQDNGAGRIGPLTSKAVRAAWNRKLVGRHANHHLTLHTINQELEKRGHRLTSFLEEGYRGTQVRRLQNQLAAFGFFPKEEVNGNFGELTKESVIAYQLDREIIPSASDTGAGVVGPATLRSLQREQRDIHYRLVRANGWKAL